MLLQNLWVIGSVDRRSGSGSTCTADNTHLVNELMLHKNNYAINNIGTLYLIVRPYCLQKNYQNWLMNVEDMVSQSNVVFGTHTP